MNKRKSILCVCVALLLIFLGSRNVSRENNNNLHLEPVDTVLLFNKAVSIIKHYEQWHSLKNYPYVAYGHRLLPNDNISLPISKEDGEKLLIKDLKKNMRYFKGSYSERLLLGMLSYNVGQSKVLKSTAYDMIKKGRYSIVELKKQYTAWCMYNGKKHKGIKQRRNDEYKLIYGL